jgi:uncharacterized protein YciI
MQSCKTALEIINNNWEYVDTVNCDHIDKLKQRHAEGKIKLVEDDGE